MATDPRARSSDEDFINQYRTIGPAELAKRVGVTPRNIFGRRRALERKYQIQINAPSGQTIFSVANYPHRATIDVPEGHVLVGSDAHIWPGPASTAMRAFIAFSKRLKPKAVVLNGDVLDLPRISRHPPIGWEDQPSPQEEIEAAQDLLHKLEMSAGRCRKIWTLGNHDQRFETRLATVAPEYARVAGVHLKDHFPLWEPCWSVWVNSDVVIKHRFKSGDHAPFNNALRSGKTMVTGHLHSAKVMPFTDYGGTRYGVDTGSLADPMHKAFVDYTEDNPKNWRAGFVVLTFKDGQLLFPELVLVTDKDHVQFRGELIKV